MKASMSSEGQWKSLVETFKDCEAGISQKKNLSDMYFDEDDESDQKDENEFSSIREKIYISPSKPSQSAKLGLHSEDEAVVRLTAASIIRKVGVMMNIPNQTIIIAQSIFQRFYFW
jgi:hypothetical protein